jgi:hypothetical protein
MLQGQFQFGSYSSSDPTQDSGLHGVQLEQNISNSLNSGSANEELLYVT